MQTRIDRAKRQLRYYFDSLAQLGEYIDRTPRTWTKGVDSSVTREPSDWDLYASYDKAVDMARNGWLEGAQQAQKALKAFAPETPRPDTKVDFYGYRPHVPRFCAGAPNNMIRRDPIDPVDGWRKVLTLAVPVNALGGVNAEYMANFGVAVAQYINQLETDGTRVEVIGMIASTVSEYRCAHSWTVKYADQPLDLAVMAFSIGHPAMFRRLGFGLRERCDAPTDRGYGTTVSATVADLINPPPGTVILNGMANANHFARTPEEALKYITQQIDAAIQAQELEQPQ